MDRVRFLNEHVDLGACTALELGALDKAVLDAETTSVFYLDHLDSDGLRRKYDTDPAVDTKSIVEVDYVWNGGSMSSAVADGRRFDLLVASHVFEHFANPVQWLVDARNLLSAEGMIFLVLPDQRFTFDRVRRHSALSDWIGWHLRGLQKPAADQVFDYFAHVGHVSVERAWRDPDYDPVPMYGSGRALHFARSAADEGAYIDAHCSVFTPYQFIELCKGLAALGLFPYRVAAFLPTEVDSLEFFVLLQSYEGSPVSAVTNAKLQEIARSVGYAGAFGGGRFARALEADAALRQRYEALAAELRAAVEEDRIKREASLFPDVDRALHHERPISGDPRVRTHEA